MDTEMTVGVIIVVFFILDVAELGESFLFKASVEVESFLEGR